VKRKKEKYIAANEQKPLVSGEPVEMSPLSSFGQGAEIPEIPTTGEDLLSFQKGFEQLGIVVPAESYPGAQEFTRTIKRVGVLQYEGVEFRVGTSSDCSKKSY